MSGCHHPVLIDERAATEVEASVILKQQGDKEDMFMNTSCVCACVRVCVCVCYLQGHLPGPGVRHRLLTIHNTRVTCDDGTDGGSAAAW